MVSEWVTVLRTWASTWTVLLAGMFNVGAEGSTREVGGLLGVVGMIQDSRFKMVLLSYAQQFATVAGNEILMSWAPPTVQ